MVIQHFHWQLKINMTGKTIYWMALICCFGLCLFHSKNSNSYWYCFIHRVVTHIGTLKPMSNTVPDISNGHFSAY